MHTRPRRTHLTTIACLAAAALVVACSDRQSPLPTQPGVPRPHLVTSASACDPDSLTFLLNQSLVLYANSPGGATNVRSRLRSIERQCGTDRRAAQNQANALVAAILRDLANNALTDPDVGGQSLDEHVTGYVNTVYRYSGSVKSGAGVATTSAEATVTTTDSAAGIRIPAGALSQDVIIIITPLPDNTQFPNNPYPVWPPVVDITTNIGPITFSTPATVGICEDAPASVQPYLRIAHGLQNSTELLPLAPPPNFLNCFGPLASNSIHFDRRDLAGSAVRAVRWAGQRLARAFMPATAYAIHGGLGGKTTSLSPFAPVEVSPGLITFDSNRDSTPTVPHDIYTMLPDGSGVTRIVSNDGIQKAHPEWSPDRTKIAFQGYTTGPDLNIYVMNADGTNLQQLTTDPSSDIAPSWSPDGTQIAFHSSRDGNSEIYVMNADGTGQTRLTTDAGTDGHPTWSPDGTKIAFTSDRAGGVFQIFTMNANGTSQTQLTTGSIIKAYPEWSPTGGKIAFEGFLTVFSTADIYVINADGSNQTQLTTDAAMDRSPSWSPLATAIVFQSQRDGNTEVYLMKPDGSSQTRLTINAAVDAFPKWR